VNPPLIRTREWKDFFLKGGKEEEKPIKKGGARRKIKRRRTSKKKGRHSKKRHSQKGRLDLWGGKEIVKSKPKETLGMSIRKIHSIAPFSQEKGREESSQEGREVVWGVKGEEKLSRACVGAFRTIWGEGIQKGGHSKGGGEPKKRPINTRKKKISVPGPGSKKKGGREKQGNHHQLGRKVLTAP